MCDSKDVTEKLKHNGEFIGSILVGTNISVTKKQHKRNIHALN